MRVVARRHAGVGAELGGEPLGVGARVRGDVVVLVGLVERGDRGDRVVEQPHEVREGVAEEAGDAHGHVDPRPAELGQRDRPRCRSRAASPDATSAARRAARGSRPRRRPACASPPCPRRRGRPSRGSSPVSRSMALEQRVGEPLADLPRQLGRQRARVDASRSCARSAARRCARASARPTARRATWRPRSARTTRGQLVGRARGSAGRPRRRRSAARARRRRRRGRAPPCTPRRGARAPVARGERVEQRHLRRPRGGRRGRRALAAGPRKRSTQRRPAPAARGAPRRRDQRRLVEPERRADRAPQARHVARAEPQHRRRPARAAARPRGAAAEHVQAVLDLDVLDLAQVAVDVLDERADVVRAARATPRSACRLARLDRRPDARRERGQLGRVEHLQARVLVEQRLELGQLVVGVGAHHRRHEVVDDRGVRAALGLHALAGVVDDERVDERQRRRARRRARTRADSASILPGSHSSVPCLPRWTIASAPQRASSQR